MTRVAAVWTRDGRNWRLASGQTPDEVRQQDEKNRTGKLVPVDVAGYVTTSDGGPAERYAALWADATGGDDARLYLGATDDDLTDAQKPLDDAKLIPRTLHALRSPDGRLRYSGVWGKPPSAGVTAQGYRDLFAWNYAENQALLSDQVLVDVAVGEAGKRLSVAERAQAAIRAGGEDTEDQARRPRAPSPPVPGLVCGSGKTTRPSTTLNAVLAKSKDDSNALELRAIAHARLGKKEPALADLARYRKDAPERSRLYLAAVVAAELGDGADAAIEALEAALRKEPGDADLRQSAALRLRAWPRRPSTGTTTRKGEPSPGGPSPCFETAVRDNDLSFALLDDAFDLDPLRDDPAFAKLLDAGHPERRFAGVWSTEARFEAATLDGLDPAEHLRRGRELASRGYRPVAWSVGRTSARRVRRYRPRSGTGRWSRQRSRTGWPSARRGRRWPWCGSGRPSRSGPCCGTAPTHGLRSFIVNWLNPLGADPRAVAAELDRLDSSPRPASGPESDWPGDAPGAADAMDAILFHPETSQRRALILALGTYGHRGPLPRRTRAAGRQAAGRLPRRPRRGRPRRGRLDPAAVGPEGQARRPSTPSWPSSRTPAAAAGTSTARGRRSP